MFRLFLVVAIGVGCCQAVKSDDLPESPILWGFVIDEAGMPLADAQLTIVTLPSPNPTAKNVSVSTKSDRKGKFTLKTDGRNSEALMLVRSADGSLASWRRISVQDVVLTITAAKTASATGRLVDVADKGLAGKRITFMPAFSDALGKPLAYGTLGVVAETDDDGAFSASGLVVGCDYWLTIPFGDPKEGGSTTLREFRPMKAEVMKLGNVQQ